MARSGLEAIAKVQRMNSMMGRYDALHELNSTGVPTPLLIVLAVLVFILLCALPTCLWCFTTFVALEDDLDDLNEYSIYRVYVLCGRRMRRFLPRAARSHGRSEADVRRRAEERAPLQQSEDAEMSDLRRRRPPTSHSSC